MAQIGTKAKSGLYSIMSSDAGQDFGAVGNLGGRAFAAVRDLLDAHHKASDLTEQGELNDYIIEICELLDGYERLSNLRCTPIAKRPAPIQRLGMLQAMVSDELKPFTDAARRLGAKDKTNGGKFSIRRVAAEAGRRPRTSSQAGYELRTSLANIEKRHRQEYGYKVQAWLKACYEAARAGLDRELTEYVGLRHARQTLQHEIQALEVRRKDLTATLTADRARISKKPAHSTREPRA
jgi:hypothetical protein